MIDTIGSGRVCISCPFLRKSRNFLSAPTFLSPSFSHPPTSIGHLRKVIKSSLSDELSGANYRSFPVGQGFFLINS